MKTILFLILVLFTKTLSAQEHLSALLPYPNHIEQIKSKKKFRFHATTDLYINEKSLSFAASQLTQVIQERMNLNWQPSPKSRKSRVELLIDTTLPGKEHYTLLVTSKLLKISGSTPTAILYGIITLDQLLLGDICHSSQNEIVPVFIDDAPRFSYRALMLDPARHFLPVKDVKFFIDQMLRYKFNTLQLHLTDDQGWRMEIKKYPRLTETGAFRNPAGTPSGPDNGFYTQDELRELVTYAALRGIEIVPELDIPGHTVAVLAAYPELGCSHTDSITRIIGQTVDQMLCAGNSKVYQLYKDIIAEVASVFPSPFIHLGGDEAVIKANWGKCSHCQALMQRLGYHKSSQLMNYFFAQILPTVKENRKKAILWCELDNMWLPAKEYLFDYPQEVTLVTWRYGLTPLCMKLTAQHGNPLIMAPGEYTYLDYPQWKGDLPEFNNWGMPVTSLKTCYEFDPGYRRPSNEQAHILGIMGTLWGEAIRDINRATYMAYPRAMALAEAGWTQMLHRNWDSFKKRLYPNLTNLMKHGVSCRIPFEITDR